MAKAQTGKQGAAQRRSKDSVRPRRAAARPTAAGRVKPSAKSAVRQPAAPSAKKPAVAAKKPAVKAPEPKKQSQGKALAAVVESAGKGKLKPAAGAAAPRIEEIKALVVLGKKKGYLTYDEIMSHLPRMNRPRSGSTRSSARSARWTSRSWTHRSAGRGPTGRMRRRKRPRPRRSWICRRLRLGGPTIPFGCTCARWVGRRS